MKTLLIKFLLSCIIGSCASPLTVEDGSMLKHAMQDRICKTSACTKAAQVISHNMDKSVKPCDNFYQFACGNYIRTTNIQKDRISASMIGQADERLLEQLKTSLEEKINENDSRTLRLLQAHYKSCLDVEKIEQTSTKILLKILNELGGWPVFVGETWDVSAYHWKDLMSKLRQIGYKKSMLSLVFFNVVVDDKNNTKYVIELDHAGTGLLHEYLEEGIENKMVQAYYEYMVSIARELGVETQRAKKELADSLNFEIQLAQISLSEEDRRNVSQLYNAMTLSELESEYPDISWKEYFNELLYPFYSVNSNERIIVRNPKYFKTISSIISKTPKRTLFNYLIWRVIQESIPFMNRKFQKIEAKFNAHITGTDTQLPRWSQCVYYLTDNIPLAIGALYVNKVFNKNLKKEGETLVQDLRRTLAKSLEKVDWMDKKTKKAALLKLRSMDAHIAYPMELLDDEKVDEYFGSLKSIPNSYLNSYLSLNLFDINDTYGQLGKLFNKTDWVAHGGVAVVNAYYEFPENSLQIPAGFFQEELFSTDKPQYMNYGVLGYFIGHELTHAFDDEGSQYDEKGNVLNWWDSETKKEYEKRARCIIEQYSNYTVEQVGLNINGITTQGENIADNGDIKQAYLAYEGYERRHGPQPRLPGLDYSSRQLFWLSNANIYCEKSRPESLEYVVMADEHSPAEYRVNGPLSNMPEFARDFDCPLGSFMNPPQKCTFW